MEKVEVTDPANLSLVAILDDTEKHGFSVRHRMIVERFVIGLTKRIGFDWRELEMLEETDAIIENIRNVHRDGLYPATGTVSGI